MIILYFLVSSNLSQNSGGAGWDGNIVEEDLCSIARDLDIFKEIESKKIIAVVPCAGFSGCIGKVISYFNSNRKQEDQPDRNRQRLSYFSLFRLFQGHCPAFGEDQSLLPAGRDRVRT